MDRYYKNIILCGEVDYYCLLCEEAFEFPHQIERHIRWEQHRKTLKGFPYYAKYKDHRIYKIGKYFYCEICNYATKTSVDNHIKDDQHLFRKSNPTEPKNITGGDDKMARQKNGTVNSHGKTMDKFEMHGIVNSHCKLCNVPVQNADHIEEVDHMVAIVQSYQSERISKMQQISKKSLKKDSKHSPEVKAEKDNTKEGVMEKKEAQKIDVVNKILTPADEKNKKINELLKKENKYFYINLNEGQARCIQCKFAIVDLTVSLLVAHRKAHIAQNDDSDSSDDSLEYTELVDHGNKRCILKKYGKKHYIKLNEGGSKGYCNLCDIDVSAHLNMFKQHVRGTRHQGMLYARRIKNGLRNDVLFFPPMIKPFHTYLEHIKLSNELNMVCLNNNIYVDSFSFYFLLKVNDSKIKCYICNEVNDYQEMAIHVSSNPHMKKVVSAHMVYIHDVHDDPSFADEFVRKMDRDLYHCGFCNKVLPYWDSVRLHLKCREHRFAKYQKQAVQKVSEETFNKSKFVKSKNNNALMKKLKNLFP